MRKFVIFVLLLFIDFISKYWVANHLPIVQHFLDYPFGGIGIFKAPWMTFSIVQATNTGIAWGMLANFQVLLLVMRILITGAIIVYIACFRPAKGLGISLTLIAAGATGNIIDYFIHGHVIDMFYFTFFRYFFPIFNVADMTIFFAVAYLLFTTKKIRFCCRAHPS
jgi:signal peptidase II